MYRTLLLLFVFSAGQLFAQNSPYSKVKIWLLDHSYEELNNLRIAIDHGSHKNDVWFITDLSSDELNQVREAGFTVDVLIDDVKDYYQSRNTIPSAKAANAQSCGSTGFEIPTVENYANGSMGGFFTYQEMLDNLDSMSAKYPNLISTRAPIDTFSSIENRPIYWLRISNTPNTDDFSKPEIMYSALHHAREPASMQQLIYYMWYVLENYDTNDELAYIVNNVEMYFVPCINPDGYIYNELTDPNGGGMHRKNRRNVGNSNKGVDLNRNYSYQYGGTGTSTNPNSDTYKGTGAFSEPETQAMEWFTINHNFSISLNYHSYADALLFPWGYEDDFQCPDHDLFTNLTNYMVRENNYDNYQSSLLYEAAGDSDDWAYGEQNDKPKVFAMTPEVGSNNDGFWPSSQNILGICRENVFQNYAAAKSLLDAYELTDLSSNIFSDPNFSLAFEFQRLGLQNATYTLNLVSIDATISNVNNPQQISGLDFGERYPVTFSGTIDLSSVQNNTVTFVVQLATGSYTSLDTIVKFFGDTQVVFEGDNGTMAAWESTGDWGLDNDAYSAPSSIGDSPAGNYSNNETNTLVSKPINLQLAEVAIAEFFAKWNIEKAYDYAQISASVDGNVWTPLCGNFTVIGNDNQDEDEPLYDGVQDVWVKESIDLSDFIGETIQLRFRLVSDQFTREDGFNFDDFKVVTIGGDPTGIQDLVESQIKLYPNPSKDELTIESDSELIEEVHIQNVLGQVVLRKDWKGNKLQLNLSFLPTGSYFALFKNEGRVIAVRHFTKAN